MYYILLRDNKHSLYTKTLLTPYPKFQSNTFIKFAQNSTTPVKNIATGVPIVVQWLTNPTRNHEVVGSIPGFAQWVKDPALP